MPTLTSHMWNCMGAVAGGMTNVVDMMFDNWPMAFQLTEGAKHAVQSPSGYYGFRAMRGFDDKGKVLKPRPPTRSSSQVITLTMNSSRISKPIAPTASAA